MSVGTEIHQGSPPVDQAPSGEGWGGSLCLAWAQIVEGEATCEHCNGEAVVLVATGADPEYNPMCWEAAGPFIEQSLKLGEHMFGGRR